MPYLTHALIRLKANALPTSFRWRLPKKLSVVLLLHNKVYEMDFTDEAGTVLSGPGDAGFGFVFHWLRTNPDSNPKQPVATRRRLRPKFAIST
jgi:hypothetical protein